MKELHNISPKWAAMEPLEPRLLLSGDLTITDNGGSLRITGDENPNSIVITRDGDTVTVTPQDGETINGVAGPADFTITRDVHLKMGDGDDVVTIMGATTAGFSVRGGNGTLRADMGEGDDSLLLFGLEAGMVNINAGRGNNVVTVSGDDVDGAGGEADAQSAIGRNLLIRTSGDGNDVITLEGVDVGGNANFSLGDGADTLVINTYQGSDANFDAYMRNVSVVTSGAVGGGDLVAFDDSTDVGDVTVERNVNIRLGAAGTGNVNTVAVTTEAALLVGRNMSVNSGRTGDLDAAFANVLANGLSIRGGNEANSIAVMDSLIGRLNATGNGDSTVNITDSLVGRLNVRTGNGADSVEILGVAADNASVSTGSGDDSVLVDGGMGSPTTDVTNAARVNLGSGDDLLTVANTNADSVNLNGGPGTDEIDDDDPTINVNTGREIGFEIGVD